VLRHRAATAAYACLTVDAAAATAHGTLEGADGFLHNRCPNSRILQVFFLTYFFTIVDYHFSQ